MCISSISDLSTKDETYEEENSLFQIYLMKYLLVNWTMMMRRQSRVHQEPSTFFKQLLPSA